MKWNAYGNTTCLRTALTRFGLIFHHYTDEFYIFYVAFVQASTYTHECTAMNRKQFEDASIMVSYWILDISYLHKVFCLYYHLLVLYQRQIH